MQNLEPQSFKRSQSSTKNIHNLRPSILSRSNSQSSISQTRKFNHLFQSIDKSLTKPSPVKVNFTYNQSSSQASNSIEKQIKASQSYDRRKQSKKQRKTFLNVISKDSVPQQVIKFVYGKNHSGVSKFNVLFSTQPTSIQTLFASKQYQGNDSNQETGSRQQFNEIRSPLIDDSLIESFPNQKVKKSKNLSGFKSTEDKVQLPQNCEIQIQHQVSPFNFDVPKQQTKEAQFLYENPSLYELQNETTTAMQTARQSWNDTIKLNQLFPRNQQQKQAYTITQSTANQSLNPFSMSQNDVKGNFKNQTQKISQFLLCDEQITSPKTDIKNTQQTQQMQPISIPLIQKDQTLQNNLGKNHSSYGYNKDKQAIAQVPVFEIKLKDLRQQANKQVQSKVNHDGILEKQTRTTSQESKPFCKKTQPIQQSQKLCQNLNVLGINIQDLAKTIERFPLIINQSSDTIQRTSSSSIDQAQTIAQVRYMAQKGNAHVNEFIPCEQEKTNRSQYKNPLPSQNPTTKQPKPIQRSQVSHNQDNSPKRNCIVDTINQSQLDPIHHQEQQQTNLDILNENISRKHHTMMGSLEVIQTYNLNPLSNSLQHFYSIPEDSLQLSSQTSHIIENPFQTQRTSKYPESLFPQLQTYITIQPRKQPKQTQNNNYHYVSPNRQKSKTNPLFQKSYQKRQQLNSNSKTSNQSIKGSPQTKTKNISNFSSASKNELTLVNSSIQKSYQNQNKSAKRQLNYEMYKVFRDKSVSKHYTKIAIDQSKSRVIELPLMDKPVQIDGSKIVYPKYIKNKVYYVKG